MEAELQREGWHLSEKGLQFCKDLCANKHPTAKEVIANAIHTDIRQIGQQILPADINKGKDSEIRGPIVLQVQKVRNVSAPTSKEDSSIAPRMLKLTMTDGFVNCIGIEVEIVHSISLSTPPGSKVCLMGAITIQHGFLLLKSYSIKFLGGEVEHLKAKWEISKNVSKLQRKVLTAEDGPPLFVPFNESDSIKQKQSKLQATAKKPEQMLKQPPKVKSPHDMQPEKISKPFEEKKIWKSEPLKAKKDKYPKTKWEEQPDKKERPPYREIKKDKEMKTDVIKDEYSELKKKDNQQERDHAKGRKEPGPEEKRTNNKYGRADEKRESNKDFPKNYNREYSKERSKYDKSDEKTKDYQTDRKSRDYPKSEKKELYTGNPKNEKRDSMDEYSRRGKRDTTADSFGVQTSDEKQRKDHFQANPGAVKMRPEKQELWMQNPQKKGLPPRMEKLKQNRRDEYETTRRKSDDFKPGDVATNQDSKDKGKSEASIAKSEAHLDKDMGKVLALLNQKMKIDGGNAVEDRRNGKSNVENSKPSSASFHKKRNENDRKVNSYETAGRSQADSSRSGFRRDNQRSFEGDRVRYSNTRSTRVEEARQSKRDMEQKTDYKTRTCSNKDGPKFIENNIEIVKKEKDSNTGQKTPVVKTAWNEKEERNSLSKYDDQQEDKVAQFMSAVVTANRQNSGAVLHMGREYIDSSAMQQQQYQQQSTIQQPSLTQATVNQPMITSSGPVVYSYLPTYPTAMYQQGVNQGYPPVSTQSYMPTQLYQQPPPGYDFQQIRAAQGYPTMSYQNQGIHPGFQPRGQYRPRVRHDIYRPSQK